MTDRTKTRVTAEVIAAAFFIGILGILALRFL